MPDGSVECVECAAAAWLVSGVCKKELYCGLGNVFAKTDTRCTCNQQHADGECITY